MTYQEQSEPFDRSTQQKRYEMWRKKLAIGIAVKSMPKSAIRHQLRVHMRQLSVDEAKRYLDDIRNQRAGKPSGSDAAASTTDPRARYVTDLE